jgi:hypothetical protein
VVYIVDVATHGGNANEAYNENFNLFLLLYPFPFGKTKNCIREFH